MFSLLLFFTLSACHPRKQLPLSPLLFVLENPFCGDFRFTSPGDGDGGFAIRNQIIQEIDGAKESIRFWFYGLDEPEIIQALVRARSRGVPMELTGSADQSYDGLIQAGFAPAYRLKSGLQHGKALLIDSVLLVSGTGNFTTSGLFHNDNAFFFLQLDRETGIQLAKTINNEGAFHPTIHLPCHGKMITSPGRGKTIQNGLLRSIGQAKHSIHYLIYSHTDPAISLALLHAASRGVEVRAVYDDPSDASTDTKGEGKIVSDGVAFYGGQVLLDGNRERFGDGGPFPHGGHLHHKTMIIDGTIVLTGSYNWSLGARDSNLELFYRFEDMAVALAFEKEFQRVFGLGHPVPPPVPDLPANRPVPRIQAQPPSIQIQIPPSLSGQTLAIFSGTGPWFRTILFRLDGKTSEYTRSSRLPASSGLDRYARPPLAPDTDPAGLVAHFAFSDGVTGDREPTPLSLPCHPTTCQPGTAIRWDLEDGWLVPSREGPYTKIQFLTREGLSTPRSISTHGDGSLFFEPVTGGDGIGFLESPGRPVQVLCLQDGAGMDDGLFQFLDELEWTTGLQVPCPVPP